MEVDPQKIPFSRWTSRAGEDVFHVDQKRQGQHHGAELMKEENRSESAHAAGQTARPDALAETHRQSGRRQSKKRGEQDGMKVSLRPREAHEIPFLCDALLCCFRLPLAPDQAFFPPSAGFFLDLVIARADQPQHGVNHEERKRAGQQQIHEQADKVEGRIQLAIARVGMRLILHEAGVGARMALAAGLSPDSPC